jgi:hypothetical protein
MYCVFLCLYEGFFCIFSTLVHVYILAFGLLGIQIAIPNMVLEL